MCVFVKAATGGKLHVFLTSLPKVGAHALPVRDGGMGAEGKDTKIMQPATKDYPALATRAAEAQVLITSLPFVIVRSGGPSR